MLLQMYDADQVHVSLFDSLIETLGLEPVSDEELFKALKNYDELPCIANVFYGLSSAKLYNKLIDIDASFEERCTWYINAIDTHFMIDNEDIKSSGELEEIVNAVINDTANDCELS